MSISQGNHSNTNNQSNATQTTGWNVQASWGALNTSNPIREIIETMNLAENPNKKVIPLSIGDPTIFGNLKPCEEILEALHRSNSCGKYYGYQTAAGMESAREAVAEYHYRCTGNVVKRQDVILASGCSHAIDLSICVLARHGQNILIPRPGFPLYKTLTSVYGIQYKQYNLIAEKNWSVDLKHLESLIDENTAAIIVNNPSNPCGSVFSKKHLLEILELAERYRKPIIADEIYDKFVFSQTHYNGCSRGTLKQVDESETGNSNLENRQPSSENGSFLDENDSRNNNKSIEANEDQVLDDAELISESSLISGQVNGNSENNNDITERDYEQSNDCYRHVPFHALSSLSETVPILTCGGISKTCLIPGLRLGWIIINDRKNIFDASVRNGLNRLTQRLMGPNSLVQGALSEILLKVPESFYSQTMDFIFKNAKLCYERLRLINGLQPHMPQGSMYLMIRFDPKSYPSIDGDLDFTSKLMNEESVLVLPGKCFDFPNYFRICLTVPTNVMEEALERIRGFCERHYRPSNRIKQHLINNGTSNFADNSAYVSAAAAALINKQQQMNGSDTTSPLLKLNKLSSSSINGQQANKCK